MVTSAQEVSKKPCRLNLQRASSVVLTLRFEHRWLESCHDPPKKLETAPGEHPTIGSNPSRSREITSELPSRHPRELESRPDFQKWLDSAPDVIIRNLIRLPYGGFLYCPNLCALIALVGPGDSFEFGQGPERYPLPWTHHESVDLCAQTNLSGVRASARTSSIIHEGSDPVGPALKQQENTH